MSLISARLCIVLLTGALACAACVPARAQGGSSPFPPRPADPACANYLAAAESLSPTVSAADLYLALARLHGCIPELGRGIAAAASILRATNDTAIAAAAYQGAQFYRDTAIFRAARTVATDPSASELMRVMSLIVLLTYPAPGQHPSFDDVTRHPPGSINCAFTLATDTPEPLAISPVASAAIDEARDAARTVLADAGAPVKVKSAAYCVIEAWREKRGRPKNAHWTFSASQLSVDYVCGNRFRFRNMHPVPITLEWRAGPSALGRTVLPRPAQGATFSEIVMDVNAPGTLTVYLDGDPLITRANAATACT